MSEKKPRSRLLRFAVSGALLVAPTACGGAQQSSEPERVHVNEPAHVEEDEEVVVNEPAPDEEEAAEETAEE